MHILPKLGRTLVISGGLALGGALLVTKMPTKIQAAEVEVKKIGKISRKNIEDEDGAIFLSSLSVMNQSGKSSQKWDNNWDK